MSGTGVHGESTTGAGVHGQGGFNGVEGYTDNSSASGVWGHNSGSGYGVGGQSTSGTGVYGTGGWNGVQGFTANSSASGVWGENSGSGHGVGGKSAGGVGVYGIGSPAGKFDGDVRITGKVYALNISLPDKDLAERFEVDPSIRAEPGMLMVIGDNGALVPCTLSYDKRAVGIVSGAGALRPAITLGEADMSTPTVPIAMIGTAHCLVDADRAPINAGDLLTSSDTVGHAMKALHSARSFGAVIGKALASLPQGRGLIPVLVCLQ